MNDDQQSTAPTPEDTVDWAFVTESPCEQCGFSPRSWEQSPGEALRASAAAWQEVLAGDDVGRRPSADTWSALEYGAHTRDVVDLFHDRITLLLEQQDPRFESWDGQAEAVSADYAAQVPASVAAGYAVAADRTAALLDGIDDDGLRRTGSRADGRTFTVEQLIDYLLHEVRHHLQDAGVAAPPSSASAAAAVAADETHGSVGSTAGPETREAGTTEERA